LPREAKNYWSYFSFNQIRLAEGKIVPAALLPHEAKQTQPFGIYKIQQVSIWHQIEKHCWSYFAIRRIQLLGLVK